MVYGAQRGWWRDVLLKWRGCAADRRRRERHNPRIDALEPRELLTSTPLISEFLASNSGGLQDRDGDTSDWIEIYNPTPAAIDLTGWSLTDNAGDLNAWQFPATSLGANQFLTVFASGKNRTTGPELHTNFRLSASGEYLALVDPLGTVVSEFTPSFPSQANNISYGVDFDTARLVTPGAAAQVLVPADDSLGNSWTGTAFNPSGWSTGTTGVGFGVVQPGFNITYVKANLPVDNLDVARNVIADPSSWSRVVYDNAPVVNYLANGGGGNFGSDLAFPTQTIGEDIDDFVVHAKGSVTIPSTGNWTFGVNSDDGFELRLERGGTVFTTEFFSPRPAFDTLATFNIPEAGEWNLTVLMYERGGGASFELFAAPGAFSDVASGPFHLVGDGASGGLAAYSTIGAGSSVVVGTDLGPTMRGMNSSAFVRVPFNVADPAAYEALLLKMRYDDGFVAYLNGIEVARRNAPGALAFNAAATADRTIVEATTPETINLTPYIGLLQSGGNVLAIQGLNSSIDDDSFLILPELTASAVHPERLRYFQTVTPGDPNLNPALGVVDRVTANIPAGFYDNPIAVSLTTPATGAVIRYTTDGSTPSPTNGIDYTDPVMISSTTTLRAAAFRTDYISLPSITRTYLYLDDVIRQSPSDDMDGGDPDYGAPPAGWPASWGNNVVDYGIDQTVVAQEGAERIKAALKAIPTISITTDLANLFDPAIGIYANAYNQGRDWERAASVELLNPDGTPGFQVNAGLRIRGGYSRSGDNPKHAFRLFFRSEYGDSSLDYPMFGNEGVNSFKKLDLRTSQNYSWSFGGDPSNTMIQDVFSRESQRDMGEPYTRSRWYQLYIDGQYWGVYQTQERAEAEYAASYFGGSAANYDVIKPETGPYTIYATDGNFDAYRRLWQFVTTQDLADNANYFHLQGKDADGLDDPSVPNEDVLLDVDNLVVYMIGVLQSGNLDAPISWFLGNQGVNNFFAIRDRTGRDGFRYFQHDGEHTLHNIYEDRNGPFPAGQSFDRFNPQFLHQQLMANPEYRLRFADAVQKFFFNDGAMTVPQMQARFQKHVDQLDLAILGESARWGDSKRPTSPLGHSDWLAAVNEVLNGFLANRNPIVLQQFRNNGLFPPVAAPQYLVNGVPQNQGQVTPGSLLRFAATGGLVYYTTDGTDPRLVGGGINPGALTYDTSAATATLLSKNSSWKFFDKGTDLGTAWRASAFNDAAWTTGNAEFGYGDGDEATTVSFGPNANAKFITTYFRKTFDVANPSAVTGLLLRLKRDDGAVVYINGVEAIRSNLPTGTITAATLASNNVGGTDEQTFFEYEINPSLLVSGNNLIAIEVHQSNASSSDLSFDAELIASSQSDLGLVINSSSHLKARTFDGFGWSPLEEAVFSTAVPATVANLAITEVHYNPAAEPGTPAAPFNDKDNFEFIELRNIGSETINLSGVRFTVGITFDFSAGDVTFLAPGQHVVAIKNKAAFEKRYGTGVLVAGVYSGNLNNGGEEIKLVDGSGTTIQNFTYDDDPATAPPWPQAADGGGYSLTLRSVAGNYNLPANWRASYRLHGTPGYEENDYPTNLTLSGTTVSENDPDALVGTLSAIDMNSGDTVAFSIVPGGEGGQFVIFGNELRVGSAGLDYEAGATRQVTIRATDRGGLFTDKTFTIDVGDVPEALLLGTDADDLFELRFVSQNLLSVTINGVSQGTINSPRFDLDGLGGRDTLVLTGGNLADAFVVGTQHFLLNQIRINVPRFEVFTLAGAGGTDSVTVRGTAGDDAIRLERTAVLLNGVSAATSEIENFGLEGTGGNDSLQVSESVGPLTFVVALTAPAAQPVSVPYTLAGSATSPADYTAPVGALLIPPGQSSAGVVLGIKDDDLDEADETIVIALGAPSGGTLAGSTLQVVTIIDNDIPKSKVSLLAAFTSATSFSVNWSGTAGVATFDVYVSDDGGAFQPLILSTTQKSILFSGQNGHTYGFYSVATDIAGNVELPPASAQSSTTIDMTPPASQVEILPVTTPTTSFQLRWSGSDGPRGSGIARYSVFVSDNSGPFNPLVTSTTATSVLFNGTDRHTYRFYSTTVDMAGNAELPPTLPDALTTIVIPDTLPPLSRVSPLPPTIRSETFRVSWSGRDTPSGSGIAGYDLLVSDNGGPYLPWLVNTPQTSALFTGVVGHTYRFFSTAIDVAGNREPAPADPQTLTTVTALPPLARPTSLEGYYFTNGNQTALIERAGDTLQIVSAGGQVFPGVVESPVQIRAPGLGNLEGVFDPWLGTLRFADGTVWNKVRQLAGRYLTGSGREAGIRQLGTEITFTGGTGATSTGQFVGAGQLIASGWGQLNATLSTDGQQINWSNGTTWTLIPEIDGAWSNAAGQPTRIEQLGMSLLFVNRVGGTSVGRFVAPGQVQARDWGNILGTLNGSSIAWSNGTVWTHHNLDGTLPDLGGVWDVNGQDTRILQTNTSLTFINRTGGVSSGHFTSATEVVADGWGAARGLLSGPGANTLTWTDNGIVWTKLPDLSGARLDGTGKETGINQLERALTFTNELGQVSHGRLVTPTTAIETDGARRTATIASDRFAWDNSGPVWTLLPDLRGNWSVVPNGAPAYVEQSGSSVLFVDTTGAAARGKFQTSTRALVSPFGTLSQPVINVGITGQQTLDFPNSVQWRKSNINALDGVFADPSQWPFV
ncbi:MAG: lamin tail domain-containing protein [Planctomycetales bacterium]